VKLLLKALISGTALVLLMGLPHAFGNVICISEPANKETAKWIVSIYSPNGTELNRFAVDGVMPRLSPDRKHIAYIECDEPGAWEFAVSDTNGNKVRTIPIFSHKSQREIFSTAKLTWSPDGDKVAILLHSRGVVISKGTHGHPVLLGVINLKLDKIKTVYKCYAKSSEAAYGYTVKWFPDSMRILFAGAGGTGIINSESKTFQEISKDSFVAHLTGDGNRIIHLSGYRKGNKSIEIWRYDLEDKSSSKLMTLSASPSFNAFSIDGRYFVYQNFPVKEPALFIVDLLNKKIEKIDTKEIIVVPVRFSPYNNHQIFCLGGKGSFDYGIYDINSGEFNKIKPIDNPENAMQLIMSSDWVDWR